VTVEAETEQQQRRRRHQRTLFDDVAQLYQATRPGYPDRVIEFVTATAGLSAGDTLLEIGCGTGQLTKSLASSGFTLTAIDIGPSMIAAARQHLASSPASFQVTTFEDFTAADRSFDLIISAAAFHWTDPEIKYAKTARLLRPGGWLAVLGNEESYDDPFGATLHDMWSARGDEDDGAWVQQRADPEAIIGTGLFDQPIQHTHTGRMARPADTVIGLENTRAMSLSWPDDIRHDFTEELRRRLRSQDQVQLTLRTTLTMARLAPRVTRHI
jgi:ubiquinone/menaquinone biosynthesis C-methylase UbiE